MSAETGSPGGIRLQLTKVWTVRLAVMVLILMSASVFAGGLWSESAQAADDDGDGRYQITLVSATGDADFGNCTLLEVRVGSSAAGDSTFDISIHAVQTGRLVHASMAFAREGM